MGFGLRLSRFGRAAFAAALIALSLSPAPALAQTDGTWDAASPGLWSDSANWLNGDIANAGGTATFDTALTTGGTVEVDLAVTLSALDLASTVGLTFTQDAGMTGSLTLDGGTGDAAINASAGLHTLGLDTTLATNLIINNTSGTDFDINNAISGAHAVTYDGPSRTEINAAQSYTGGSTVNGLLSVNANGSLVGTGNITVGPTGELRVHESAGNSAALNAVDTNTVVLNTGRLRINTDAAIADYLHASSTGGTILLGANNTNDLNLSDVDGGTGDGSAIQVLSVGSRTMSGILSFGVGSADPTLRIGSESGTFTISSDIDTATNSIDAIRVIGGRVAFGGTNSYTGTTVIESGFLEVHADSDLGAGTTAPGDGTTVMSTGTLEVDGGLNLSNERITLDGGTLSILATGTQIGPIDVSGDDSFISVADLSIENGLSGSGSLFLSGQISLASESSLSGSVSVQSGTLTIDPIGSLIAVPSITVAPNATLTISEQTGSNPSSNSVATQSVILDGGVLGLGANVDHLDVLNGASTGGALLLHGVTGFDADGASVIDLEQVPGGTGLTLGAASDSSIASSVVLTPDATSKTLRLGIGTAVLTVEAQIADSTDPTDVFFDGPGITSLAGANTFSGTATLQSGTVRVDHSDGLGSTSSGTAINGGIMEINAAIAETITLNDGELRIFTAGQSDVTVLGGALTINDSAGVHDGDITIESGDADFASPTSGTITQNGGTLNLNGSGTPHTGSFLFNDGVVTTQTTADVVNGLVTVGGDVRFETHANGIIDFAGGVAGAGGVTIAPLTDGQIRFGSTYALTGDTVVAGVPLGGAIVDGSVVFDAVDVTGNLIFQQGTAHVGGDLSVSGDVTVSGDTTLDGNTGTITGHTIARAGAALTVNGDLTTGKLTIDGGNSSLPSLGGTGVVDVTSGSATLIRGLIDFSGGSIDSGLDITKVGYTREADLNDVGATFDGVVGVEQGRLRLIGGAGLGSGSALVSARNASLTVETSDAIANTIALNNATGFGFSGGLRSETNEATITGNVDLGPQGSILGGPNLLTINGSIQGGSLDIIDLDLRITGSANTYTGATRISNLGLDRAYLTLKDSGAISTTSQITTEIDGRLEMINSFADASDRVADHIPIIMRGGRITLEGLKQSGTTTTETVGSVTAQSGAATILALGGTNGNTAELTLSSLTRLPGATVDFQPNNTFARLGVSVASAPDQRVFISGQATSDFLGPAFTVAALDFAKYDVATGVRAFDLSEYQTGTSETTWAATDNIRQATGSVTLTGDRSINSLRLSDNFGQVTIDLDDHVLNIESGGLINSHHRLESGAMGRLTAGGAADAELIVHTGGSATITANISDNAGPDGQYDPVPGGALDADNGVVSVTFTIFDGGLVWLGGNNTYSGTTTVNSGRLYVASANAVSGGDLVLNGGIYETSSDFDVTADQFIMRGGWIYGSGDIVANAFEVEGGRLSKSLLGNGTLTKTSNNLLEMDSNPGFTGDIILNGGVTRGGGWLTDGLGGTTINDGAVLTGLTELYGYIDLNGGTLGASFQQTADFTGQRSDGSSRIRVLSDSFVQTFNSEEAVLPSGTLVKVSSRVEIANATTLSVLGDGELRLSGGIAVTNSNTIHGGNANVMLTGLIESAATSASLNLVAADAFSVGVSVNASSGQSLTILFDGVNQTLALGAGQSASGNGTLLNALTVADGGAIAPGASVGTLTVGADVEIAGGGGFAFEISDAFGAAGTEWDALIVNETLNLTATALDPIVIELLALGDMLTQSSDLPVIEWAFVSAKSITGFDPDAFTFDASSLAGTAWAGSLFEVRHVDHELRLRMLQPIESTIPTPTALAVLPVAMFAIVRGRGRRRGCRVRR